MSTKLLWTALPNHADERGAARLSVFVTPRLATDDGSDAQLEKFAELATWPKTLGGLTFRVELGDGSVFPDLKPAGPVDEQLWSLVFPDSALVRAFEFKDHRRRDIHVFPVRQVLQFLRSTYTEVARGGAVVPSLDDPDGPLAPFSELAYIPSQMRDWNSYHRELARASQDPGTRPDGVVVAEPDAFSQAYRFYYRPGTRRELGPERPVDPPEFDFHERVALLADHPELLRRLGLVIDLVLDARPEDLASPGLVRVTPTGDVPDDPERAPWTAFESEPGFFGAQPRDAMRMARGLLRLNREFFDFFQVDVDGAALKVIGFGDSLERLRDPSWRRHDTPDDATVPALRSAGYAVARIQRGQQLLGDLGAVRDQNADVFADPPVILKDAALHAEDVTRGYRVDVFDRDAVDGPRWFTLHGRLATYAAKDTSAPVDVLPLTASDEGYVKGVSAASERSDHDQASDDLYLHETLFGWEGWSLSAPRPGKRIVDPGEGDGGSDLARFDADAANPNLPLTTSVRVRPDTLPRLRVGHQYRMRARTVDLAGNSLPFAKDDLPAPTADLAIPPLDHDPEPYLRFEPIPSPTILRRRPDTEGESLDQLVIRSNYPADVSAESYAASPEVQEALAAVEAAHSYHGDSQRHLAAPKTSQLAAEEHGRFDHAFSGGATDADAALRLALREEGNFLDETIVDTGTGKKTVPQLGLDIFPSGSPPAKGDPLQQNQYALHTDDQVRLPYLPDPLAAGVAIVLFDLNGEEAAAEVARFPPLDSVPDSELLSKLAESWPQLDPFRLRLSEGPLGVSYSGGVLELTLPKAAVVHARLSSLPPAEALDWFAVWRWLSDADRTALANLAASGRHWMLTPFRRLTFTHAVQQPLEEPDSSALTHERRLGDTTALFRGAIGCHAGSTGRLDVAASWTEELDLLTDDEPHWSKSTTPGMEPVAKTAAAFGFDIGAGEDRALASVQTQGDWRRCVKCQGLVFGGNVPPKGTKTAACPAGGVHRLDRTTEYRLFHNDPAAPGQADWRWCHNCQGLAFGGNPPGPCPSGGTHSQAGSGNYTLPHGEPQPLGQPGWRWCKKCQGVAYAAEGVGPCPAGGSHDHSGSGAYALHRPPSAPPTRESRHAFGDTKYRKVEYRAIATTRFRELFPRSITDTPELIQRPEPTARTHHVLSTARPAAPDIVYTLPTFRWERDDAGEQRVHVRHGKAVRIYLRRPWFSSGDGEKLGVVIRNPEPVEVAPDWARAWNVAHVQRTPPLVNQHRFSVEQGLVASAPPAGSLSHHAITVKESAAFAGIHLLAAATDPLIPYVTNWGSDPVWQSAAPHEQPALTHFPSHTAFGANLSLEELDDDYRVAVAAHDVQFDRSRRLWYCDVEIDPGNTYFPFVRLALARYQPMSLVGAHVSRVATTDFIQIVPNRTASVALAGNWAHVTVQGFSGRNKVAEKDVPPPYVGLGLDPVGRTRHAPAPPGPSTIVRVAVEKNDGGGDDLAWTRVGDEMPLQPHSVGYNTTWAADVELPAGAVGSGVHRILLTEVEEYERDITPTETMAIAPLIVIDTETGQQVRPTRERIVYADAFLL